MRKTIYLNYDWDFIEHFDMTTSIEDINQLPSTKIDIPHTVKLLPLNHFDDAIYQMIACYRHRFSLDEIVDQHHYYLHFDGVMTTAKVIFNGKELGEHLGGYTPFDFDVTSLVKEDNEVICIVDTHEIPNVPPFGNVVDYLGYGGIYREVYLEVRPEQCIEEVTIKTRESISLQPDEMTLDLTLSLSEDLENAYLDVYILDEDKEIFKYHQEVTSKQICLQEDHKGITRWDLDHPKRYQLKVNLYQNQVMIDTIQEDFGYRDAKFSAEGFTLNNKVIKLRGLNRHQSYPYVGYAMPKRMQEKDADLLKFTLGVNIVRCSHYMQSDHFIRRCDEIGLLVFEEIPGWQYIGDEQFKALSLQNLESMIKRHKNHPSIILWGTRINESKDDHDFYELLSDKAMELDDSRQTGGVRNFQGSELLEDVYTYNDFSHTGKNTGLENPMKVARNYVPYLVTEHNGHMFPTKIEDDETHRCEQAMRHLNVIESSYQSTMINGVIGWCFADYNTHKDFGSGDRVCYHGVMDMFRNPKYASATYQSQQNKTPFLEVLSNMNIGEYQRGVLNQVVVMSNCDYIKIYHNDQYVQTYYPDYQIYPKIPHAPYIIDDFIGDRIEKEEAYRKGIAKKIKKVLLSYNKYGFEMPFLDKLRMANLMVFHHISMDEAMRIYSTYLGNWGSDASTYRFEGYLNDELVVTKTKGQTKEFRLSVSLDDEVLLHRETYDVTKITTSIQDEYQNVYPYTKNVASIKTTDELEVIGNSSVPFIGGYASFYVRTKKTGKATVSVNVHGYEEKKLFITVE